MQPAVSASAYLATLPIEFLRFWFLENPKLTWRVLSFIFAATVHQLGYQSLFKTFFQPWKNEYREGLEKFSLFMGIFIKSILILVDTIIILLLLAVEAAAFIFWVFLPVIAIWGIYVGLFT